ncbi:MAG: hypothetical protein Q8L57_01690, partial [bacterium]|nr:hypothetical protein [bacterium]
MKNQVSVELMDKLRGDAAAIIDFGRLVPFLAYADIRVEISEGQGAAAENGEAKASGRDYGFSFGIRVIAGINIQSAGYFGQALGAADLDKFYVRLLDGFMRAYWRAMVNSDKKWEAMKRFPGLADSFFDTRLAPVEVCVDTVPAEFRINPLSVPLVKVVDAAVNVSKIIAASAPEIRFNFVSALTGITRKLFMSTEGAVIDQTCALTQGFCYAMAASSQGQAVLYDIIGHQRGWEVIEEGVNEEFIKLPNLENFGREFAGTVVK